MSELNTSDVLFVVYSDGQSGSGERYIDMAFTKKGLVDFEEVNFDNFLTLSVINKRVGPIDNHEELVKFSYYLSEKTNSRGVCLCDTEATNSAMMDAKTTVELHQCLLSHGDVLENPEKKNQGFFSNLLR